jgi:hypothetical protein
MKTAGTSETAVNFYQTAGRYNPEGSHLPEPSGKLTRVQD